jgi:predicted DNA-binding transcriptional regulator AlpA
MRVFGEDGSGVVLTIQACADWRSLTTAEASEMLGIRPATLRGWKAQRIGPPFIQLSPRCVRYAESDILQYANERRVVPSVRETGETS